MYLAIIIAACPIHLRIIYKIIIKILCLNPEDNCINHHIREFKMAGIIKEVDRRSSISRGIGIIGKLKDSRLLYRTRIKIKNLRDPDLILILTIIILGLLKKINT